MATSTLELLLTIFFILSPLALSDQQCRELPIRPSTIVLPVSKDSATNLHVTNIQKGTPFSPTRLLVDLNNKFLWVNCETFWSTSYRVPYCHSTQCSRVGSHYCHRCLGPSKRGCHNNTCGVMTTNPLTQWTVLGEMGQDIFAFKSALGAKVGPTVSIPLFMFSCAPPKLLTGPLPRDVQGIAGLGHNPVAIPYQITSHYGFGPKFALCLPSTDKRNGVIFIGREPYMLDPGLTGVFHPVGFTPITAGPRGEYYIQVTGININHKALPLEMSSFSRTKKGSFANALISTTTPYTTLHHSIFMATTKFFSDQLSWAPRVEPPVSPFGVCFNSSKIARGRAGPAVPSIDLVLQKGNGTWSISGANSMVQAKPDVLCLGFVDGGLKPRHPIVIGALQLEDNVLEFDLAKSMLGFSNSLLFIGQSCADFNFTIPTS